ncbi:MAG TPA: GNAT family N-acetyltransferase [Chryseolinea sp.]|nr:GNAT family N-acetyltransferase [Chryseolinea sp.]
MIQYTTAGSDQHLQGILDLQRQNLARNLDESELRSQGFVTVLHTIEDLRKMNAFERHVIAVDDERVVAYLLAMTWASRNDIPVLVPMFDTIASIVYAGRPLVASSYIVVGQACVDKSYRGQGVFDEIYRHYARCFRDKYPYVITEIDTANTRSIRAHRRVGFETIKQYTAPDGVTWQIVLWDWK